MCMDAHMKRVLHEIGSTLADERILRFVRTAECSDVKHLHGLIFYRCACLLFLGEKYRFHSIELHRLYANTLGSPESLCTSLLAIRSVVRSSVCIYSECLPLF